MDRFKSLPTSAKNAYRAARLRSKARGVPVLSEEEFVDLWSRSNERCALSGLPFSDEVETYREDTGYKRLSSKPWQPSLDQIIPGLGYGLENCQLVCKCVNIGKSGYTEETFKKWVFEVARRLRG